MTRGREPAAWWVAGALVALALLVPTIWNGFPLLFSDSGEYLVWAWGVIEPRYRTLGYSAFLRLGAVAGSVWPVVLMQSAWAAAVLVIAWRTVWPASSALAYGLGGLALAAGTALSLATSQLMPDLWSGLVVVAAALVVSAWAQLSTRSRAVLVTTLVLGGAMHVTHLAIGASVALVAGLCVRRRSTWHAALEPTGRALLAMAGGATLAIGLSGAMTGRAVLSRNGHVFVLAHLVDTGIAQRLLREHCDTRAYALCPYRAELDTLDGEAFVWHRDAPFRALGGWSMPPAEAERMLADAWRDHPVDMVWKGVTLSAAQFVAVRPDDALRIGDRQLLNLAFDKLLSDDQDEYLAARQQRGPLSITGLVTVHQGVALAAWLLGALLLVAALRRSAGLSGDLLVAAWVGLVTNAVLCANFAVVRDRYQARLLWVLPLAVILDLAVRRSARAR